MAFPAAKVGLYLTPYEVEVTPRLVLAYSAGLCAGEAAFLDDAGPDGLCALPFQCVSPEWPVVLSMRQLLGDSLSVEEARRGVHAVQDSRFHRPMRPGDRLVVTGQLVSASKIRSGVLATCKLVTSDRETGAAVTTTWTRSIYRNVALIGDPTQIEVPPPGEPDWTPGPKAEAVTIPIPREMPHVYSECANIWNPIHTERRQALAAGLPDIILHGTATWALAGLTLLRRYGSSKSLNRLTGRFSGIVIPGDPITICHEAIGAGRVRFEVRTAFGNLAISQGLAEFNG